MLAPSHLPTPSASTTYNEQPALPQTAPSRQTPSPLDTATLPLPSTDPYPSATPLGIRPVIAHRSGLSEHFQISDQQLFVEQNHNLQRAIDDLQLKQPSFRDFVQEQLELAFPGVSPLNAETLVYKQYRKDGETERLTSSQPLIKALAQMIQDIFAKPNQLRREPRKTRYEFSTLDPLTGQTTPLTTSSKLHSIARTLAYQYPTKIQEYWTSPPTSAPNSKPPIEQLGTQLKQQLSNLAALRVTDGTLSATSKQLIDHALQYPTLAARERALNVGARPGVYPITLDNNTEQGAVLAGAFMITRQDGSSATPPTWPSNSRSLALDERNGPVVLYTPSEGFEEFSNPAQLRQALAQRLDKGGVKAELLLQSLTPPVKNGDQAPAGEDLMLGAEPWAGDVFAQGLALLLNRPAPDITAAVARAVTPGAADNKLLQDPKQSAAIQEAAIWSYLLDGNNALLARNDKLAEKQQPSWLKDLSAPQLALYDHLERTGQRSAAQLAPLLEKIPSLTTFANTRIADALKREYPHAQLDPNQLQVTSVTKTRFHLGRSGVAQAPSTNTQKLSLTDLALRNPTQWEGGESGKYTQVTLTMPLTDTQGQPIRDTNGNPVVLGTDALKALVNKADVGGEYATLLEKTMTPGSESDAASTLRAAWAVNHADQMEKEAFLAQHNPDAYKAVAKQDITSKRGAQWVNAILDHPDPKNRPLVDGQKVVANTLTHLSLPVNGVVVIGTKTDASLVLYTPDAPDGIGFREVADMQALNDLLNQKKWNLYVKSRQSKVKENDFVQAVGYARKAIGVGQVDPYEAGQLLTNLIRAGKGATILKPVEGNLYNELYKQQVNQLIDTADAQSTSSAEVAAQSKANKVQFGIEVASIFLDVIPVIGRGISTGLRLGRAALTALRANHKILPSLISQPGRLRAVYADFSTVASGVPLVRNTPLRPVPRATTVTAVPLAPAVPGQSVTAVQGASSLPTAGPSRAVDLSAHIAKGVSLDGATLRADGTYQIADKWYIRYTDSTGVSRPYEIGSSYKARYGQANIIDQTSGARVANVQHAGGGEWRLNALPGGNRHRNRMPVPLDDYMDRVINGAGANDFNKSAAASGHYRRWFRRDMQDFYASQASGQIPARPVVPELGITATPEQAIQNALSQPQVRGLVLGETHYEPAGYRFLIEQMRTFAENGVSVIYLENAPFLPRGPGFATGSYAPADAIAAIPRVYDAGFASNPTTLEVIEAARAENIHVIGLEHPQLTGHADNLKSRYNNIRFWDERLQELNYAATRIIDQTPKGQKFVALVGKAHMNTYNNVPGLAELTSSVGISLAPTPRGVSSMVSQPPHTPPPPLKFLHGTSIPEPIGDIHIDYNIDKALV